MTVSSGHFLRIVIIALAFLIALQILIVGASYLIRTAELARPAQPRIIEQIGAAAALVDKAAPEERRNVLRAISSPFMAFSLLPEFPEDGVGAMRRPLPEYRPVISMYQQALGKRDFRIFARKWRRFKGAPPIMPAEVVVAIRLGDGSALIVEPSAEYRRQLAVNVAALASSVLGVLLLCGLVWASFETTRPLRDMAAAAERLAADLDAPALPERGPKPVRDLARALNSMQTDLRRLVSERSVTLAAVAHDFRTYLTRLRLRADFIDDLAQRAKAEKDIDEMSALIDDTLLYAQAGAAGVETGPFDAAALLRDVAQGMNETHPGAVSVETPATLQATGHEGFMRRAATNLLDNARKYGGAARARLDAEGALAALTIEDDGKGLTRADLDRLTEPFFRVEGSRSRVTGGAGLGLAIARRLIEASGGRLELDLTAQGGLRARVLLSNAGENVLS
jgi:signal transduction histidine kinase